MNRNIHTFIGCDNEYEESKTVIFSAPFDSTTSYRPGARFAGSAIRNESYSIETYSPYQDKDLLDVNVFDGGELELPFGDPSPALGIIEEYVASLIEGGKTSIMIGGEHLVTLGAVRAVAKMRPDLHLIQFDAHADLRNDYLGSELSHATVIRRCHDILGDGRIFQFGIRSGERDEFTWAKEHTCLNKFNFDGLDDIIEKLKNKAVPVYLTIDLDVLDPSCFPGTGTPEAGGASFTELLNAVTKITKQLNVVALDINELSPVYDQSGVSTSLACKLLREILLLVG